MLERVRAVAAGFLGRSGEQPRIVSLVSHWLAGVLYLIETKFLPLAQKAFGQNSIVYAVLRFLSQSVPEPPLKVYRQINITKREEQEADHPLVKLIKFPNELMTEYEMFELITLHLSIVGRTVWWKERDRKGQVSALWPLRPDRVAPVYSVSDEPGQRVVWGFSYQIPGTGQFVKIPRTDTFFFNYADPASESGGLIEGLGPIAALAREVSADNEATQFVGALLANYAAPTIAIKVKAAVRDEATAAFIKAKFRSEFGGSRRGTPALLDGDTDIKVLGFNLRELEFEKVRGITESRICAAVGVPPVLVGLKVGLEHSTFSNMEEARAFFTEVTLSNIWRRIEDGFNTQICPEFGDDIIVEFDLSKVKALAGRHKEQIQPVLDGFGKGVVTRNEYRQALGLPLLKPEIGDILVVTGQVTEIPTSEAAKKALEKKATEQQAVQQPALPPGAEESKEVTVEPEIPEEEEPAEELQEKPAKKPAGKMYAGKPAASWEALQAGIGQKLRELSQLEAYRERERSSPKLADEEPYRKLLLELLELHKKMRDFESSAVTSIEARKAVEEAERILSIRSADTSTVWLGMYLPKEVAEQLALDNPLAEPAKDLHMTLAVLHAPTIMQLENLSATVSAFCLQAGSLEAKVSGLGRFSQGDTDVFYASVDCGSLPQFREALISWLENAGLELDTAHGFTPHITLAYISPETDLPEDRLQPVSCRLGILSLSVGRASRQDFALAGRGVPEEPEDVPALKYALVSDGDLPFPGQPLIEDRNLAERLAAELGAEAVEIRGVGVEEMPVGVELVNASS